MGCPKVVCVGRNYLPHIRELRNAVPEEPVLFLKPYSALSDRPPSTHLGYRCHFEGELCFRVVGGRLGEVGFGLDLTLRDLQRELKGKGLPWDKAKGFKGGLLLSPFVKIESWEGLELRTYLNGELRQQGGVEEMLFPPDRLLREAERWFGIEDGDILMTGTPAGTGPIHVGDEVVGEVWQKGRRLLQVRWRVEE